MAQEQNYQVNYTINVDASQGTKQVIAFGEAVGKLVQAKASLTPAVTNIKNMMDEIDRVFRTKNGKKRSFDYRLTIDTKTVRRNWKGKKTADGDSRTFQRHHAFHRYGTSSGQQEDQGKREKPV